MSSIEVSGESSQILDIKVRRDDKSVKSSRMPSDFIESVHSPLYEQIRTIPIGGFYRSPL